MICKAPINVVQKWLSYKLLSCQCTCEYGWSRCHCRFDNTRLSLEQENNQIGAGAAAVVVFRVCRICPEQKEEPAGQMWAGRGLVPALRGAVSEATRGDGQKILRQPNSRPTNAASTRHLDAGNTPLSSRLCSLFTSRYSDRPHVELLYIFIFILSDSRDKSSCFSLLIQTHPCLPVVLIKSRKWTFPQH